jgi:Mg2+ and Co2+ transporter CorA
LKLSGIIWLEEIVEKIERKHHVTQDEVREVLEVRRISDSLRKATAKQKTLILHWAKQTAGAI